MSIRAQREAYKIEIVKFLVNYQHTLSCSVHRAVHDFLDPNNPWVTNELRTLAKAANENGMVDPSSMTLTRWYGRLKHLFPEPQRLELSTAVPSELVTLLQDVSAYLKKQGLGNRETYELLVRVNTTLEQL